MRYKKGTKLPKRVANNKNYLTDPKGARFVV